MRCVIFWMSRCKTIGGRISRGAVTERGFGSVNRLLHCGPILRQTNEFLVEDRVGDEPASKAFEEDRAGPPRRLRGSTGGRSDWAGN
jgi:hypothetical protein